MAGDRIEGVLQIILHAQEAPGFAEDSTSNSRRIPPYNQNLDGEIEGMIAVNAVAVNLICFFIGK